MAHVKTAISLPDALFQRLENAAAAESLSRSAVVALALQRYLDQRANLTDLIDSALDSLTAEELAAEEAVANAATERSLQRLRNGEHW